MEKKILNEISERFKDLTPSQKKIAQYIHDNSKDVFLHDAAQLARTTGVSAATVSRFINILGFSGFAEFQRQFAHQVLEGYSTTERLQSSAENLKNGKNVFSEILKSDIENIQEIPTKISDSLFDQALKRLCSARFIYVVGLRSSYALAFYFAFTLRFFFQNKIILIKPGISDLPEQIFGAKKGDLLVVISFKRYTRDTYNIAEKIKKRGVSLLAITNSALSPVAKLADVTLLASTKIPTYIESYTAPMSLINALITGIALRMKNKALPALKDLEIAFEEFKIYTSS